MNYPPIEPRVGAVCGFPVHGGGGVIRCNLPSRHPDRQPCEWSRLREVEQQRDRLLALVVRAQNLIEAGTYGGSTEWVADAAALAAEPWVKLALATDAEPTR